MMPQGYERGLMRRLLAANQSIFRCDGHQVFSDGAQEIGPGPQGHVVMAEDIGSTKATMGGPFNNVLNGGIFARVWKRVFRDAAYSKLDWTVKVDPDCVFLPDRLRTHLDSRKADPASVVYLNDCDQGLHGPIEVVSNGGMESFREGMDKCVDALSKEWTWAGEDVFLRHCLGMLKINRVDDFALLSETACMWNDPVKKGCGTEHIAFHPFKQETAYFKCLAQAHAT
jgi:hypothetical protein